MIVVIGWIIVLVYSYYVCRTLFFSEFPHGIISLKEIQWSDTWSRMNKWMKSTGSAWIGICIAILFLGQGIRTTFASAERDGSQFITGLFWAMWIVLAIASAVVIMKENEKLKKENAHLKLDLEVQKIKNAQ